LSPPPRSSFASINTG